MELVTIANTIFHLPDMELCLFFFCFCLKRNYLLTNYSLRLVNCTRFDNKPHVFALFLIIKTLNFIIATKLKVERKLSWVFMKIIYFSFRLTKQNALQCECQFLAQFVNVLLIYDLLLAQLSCRFNKNNVISHLSKDVVMIHLCPQ